MSIDNCPFELYEFDNRLTTMPIYRTDLWSYVKHSQRLFWTPDEIVLTKDKSDFDSLSENIQKCVRGILAFFATGDAIVNINLAQRFKNDVPILEASYFYDFQIMMENIHAETYALQLMAIITDENERKALLNAAKEIPAVEAIANYMKETISSDKPFAERLLRMACVEGIIFSGCFCIIYWLAYKNKMPGLTQANIFIARDEGLHTDFALHLYLILKESHKLSLEKINDIFNEALTIAVGFVTYMMPEPIIELNPNDMINYLKYLINKMLNDIKQPILYADITKNPMTFMNTIGLPERTNFFELRSATYSKPETAITEEYDNDW